jgi:hypothetical protein
MAGQMIGLLISIVLPANFIGVLIIGNWRGVDPVSDPVIGRLFAAFVVVYFPVLLFGAASFGVIADQRVWRRSVGVFGFWCWVIGLCCPPTMGADSLGKGLLLGGAVAVVSALFEWSCQLALTGEFDTPRFSLLATTISTPIFVFWSLIAELTEWLRPKGRRWMSILAESPTFTVIAGVIGIVGYFLPWNTILDALHRAFP